MDETIKRNIMKKLLFIFILFLPVCVTAQNYEASGDQAYAAGNYNEAKIQYEAALALLDYKNVDKNSSEYLLLERKKRRAVDCIPLLERANGLMEAAKANPSEESYGRAKSAYQTILQKNAGDRFSRQQILLCDKTINSLLRSKEDNALWTRIHGENNKELFKRYLAEFPDGLHAAEANNALMRMEEEELWNIAKSLNTEEAYNDYIANTKTSDHASEAKYAIGIIRDNQIWETLKDGNNEQGLLDYIADPDNICKQYLEKANAYLAVLRAKRYSVSSAADAKKIINYLSKAKESISLDTEAQKILETNKALLDYEEFKNNPTIETGEKYLGYDESITAHRTFVENKVARLYADSFSVTNVSNYNKALQYATDTETRKYVKAKYDTIIKQKNKWKRQRAWSDRWQLGLGAEYEFDFKGNNILGATAEIKIGSTDDWFNFSVGAKYLMWNSGKVSEEVAEEYKPKLGVNQVPVFAVMKFNMGDTFYMALQGSYNFNFAAKFKAPYMSSYWADYDYPGFQGFVDGEIVEDSYMIFKNNITAGLRLGFNIDDQWDLGLYMKYDITPMFDSYYISTVPEYGYYDDFPIAKMVNSRLRFGINLIYNIIL